MKKHIRTSLIPKLKNIFTCSFGDGFSILSHAQMDRWSLSHGKVYYFSRSTFSINFLLYFYNKKYKRKINVYVPGIFCDDVIKLMNHSIINIIYYKLDANYQVDLNNVSNLALQNIPDILIVVCFFGLPVRNVGALHKFCVDSGAILIHDSTHKMMPLDHDLSFADFEIYSLHKHLPLPFLALLVVRFNGPSGANIRVDINSISMEYKKFLEQFSEVNFSPLFWKIKKILQIFNFDSISNFLIKNRSLSNKAGYLKQINIAADAFSIRLLKSELGNINIYLRDRRQIGKLMISIMNLLSLSHKFDFINSNDYPYLIGLVSSSVEESILLKNKLESLGFSPVNWPDIPEKVFDLNYLQDNVTENQKTLFIQVHNQIPKKTLKEIEKKLINSISCKLEITELNEIEWNSLYKRTECQNIIQNFTYGNAISICKKREVRRFTIKYNGADWGIFQGYYIRILGINFLMRINRGPLLINADCIKISATQLSLILIVSICKKFKALSIAPNIFSSHINNKAFSGIGLFFLNIGRWQSGVLNLEVDESELLKKAEGRWRTSLKKSNKAGVKIRKNILSDFAIGALIIRYSAFVAEKKFDAISPCIIEKLLTSSNPNCCTNFYSAFLDEEYLGDLISVRTGIVETYLIGITNENGRRLQANTALLWESIISSKREGAVLYDLGGIPLKSKELSSISKFKMSLNPRLYSLIGEWIKFY